MKNLKGWETQSYVILKEEVYETYGRRIASYRDCVQLADEIYNKTSFRIHQNTLRRYFGLVRTEHAPSLGTIDILSKYCGFDSLNELLRFRNKDAKCNINGEGKSILNYLVSLFEFTKIRNVNDETFLAVVKQVILFLQKNPELIDKFQRAIAKTKNGQEFYFEQFVNIDKLNFYYGDGLRFYLNEKKTIEAQIFGNSLLLFKAWLSNDGENLKKHFNEVTKKRLPKNVPPFASGHYYASHLFHAEQLGFNTQEILLNTQHVHNTIKSSHNKNILFPEFEYTIVNALVLTHHYKEALYYLDYAENNYATRHSYIYEGYYGNLNLMKSIALSRTGEKKKAIAIYNSIRPSQFFFLSKKTNMMLYFLLSGYLNKKRDKEDEQFQKLIEETGYIKYLSF